MEVTAETSKLKKSLDAAQSRLKDFGRACQGLGRDMMALGGALSLPFALAEKSFAGFDDKMRLVQAVTSSTGDQFDSLTKTAQRLGRETSFTAQQVADAMIGLGRMGFDPSEITAAIEHVLNLSRATGTDLAESADIAANSLRIFGLEAGKMSHVADILTATANGSAQTLTDLFEGLKMAGPSAAAAGENVSELCASLGIMANMGIKGSLAGTALRKAYVQFADVKVQNVLRDVGVEAVDANGNLRKMAEIMRDVAAATSKMPTAERLSFMKDVFDVRGMMSGLSLAGNIEELDKFLARLRDVSGQADETARAMDRGIGGSFRLFQSAVEGTMNAVGDSPSGWRRTRDSSPRLRRRSPASGCSEPRCSRSGQRAVYFRRAWESYLRPSPGSPGRSPRCVQRESSSRTRFRSSRRRSRTTGTPRCRRWWGRPSSSPP